MNFSNASRHAAEFAVRFAAAVGAEVELLHVYTDAVPATVGPEPWKVTVSGKREEKDGKMLEEIDFLSRRYNTLVKGQVRVGFKGNTIRKILKDEAFDLTIVGLKQGSNITGNTLSRIIRRAHKPVLVIPEDSPLVDLKHIVLALEFSYLSNYACFDPLFEIVQSQNASLDVIHVEGRGADGSEGQVSAKLDIGRMLSKVSYQYVTLENDDTGLAVLQYTQNHPTDLRVMVARHHPFVWRYFW